MFFGSARIVCAALVDDMETYANNYLALAKGDPWLEIALRGAAAAVVSTLTLIILSMTILRLIPGYRSGYQKAVDNGVLRNPHNPLSSWVLLGHPIVLTAALSVALEYFGLRVNWPGNGNDVLQDAVALGTVLFLVGAGPGIFLDFASFRLSAVIVPAWWITSYATWVVVAFFTLYGRPGHGTAVHFPNVLELAGGFAAK